jgi:hypothetical protein
MNDTRYLLLVCQQSFSTSANEAATGFTHHSFCKLIPLMSASGERADTRDFRNDGEVWWMLTNQTRPLAKPGTLITAALQEATPPDRTAPTSSLMQADRDSVRKVGTEFGFSIIEHPNAPARLEDLISNGFSMRVDFLPTDQAFVRGAGYVTGPYKVSATETVEGRWLLKFSPAAIDKSVIRCPSNSFLEKAGSQNIYTFRESVSRNDRHRKDGGILLPLFIELLSKAGYDRLLSSSPERLVLESTAEKLNRIITDLGISRAKRQQLRALLSGLDIDSNLENKQPEHKQLINDVLQNITLHDEALDQLAGVMVETGLLGEDRLSKAEARLAQRYVDGRKAQLDAEIQKQVQALQTERACLESEVAKLRKEKSKTEQAAKEAAQKATAAERAALEADMGRERAALQRDHKALENLRATIQGNLAEVSRDMKENGEAIVKQFLAIAPLLNLNGARAAEPCENPAGSLPSATPAPGRSEFHFPDFSVISRPSGELSEKDFIQRVVNLVDASGLTYRRSDLIRFHLSVKLGGITVLGGRSGTGKSTLPQIYAKALLGDATEEGRDCLMIPVSPGWMDSKDMLGFLNTMDGRFHPSESGLYLELLRSGKEFEVRGMDSLPSIVCLDEMNLAQVEHYMGDLMTVIEREGRQRQLRVFDEHAVSPHCPFRRHGVVPLSPSLRFVGTVNFDETTRLFSDRFLDRVNLIELHHSDLPDLAMLVPDVVVEGSPVTIEDFSNWTHHAAIPPELAELLDKLRPSFAALGCPISPRTYRAICGYVASANGFISAGDAFDAQLAQRVLARVRNVHKERQLDAMDKIRELIGRSSLSEFAETTRKLDACYTESAERDWSQP